jgi:riboflavin synthase
MFTGIVTAVGKLAALERGEKLTRIAVDSPYNPASIAVGASIAHNGCCLTVTAIEPAGTGARHWAEIAAESLARTTLGAFSVGDRLNLERSLAAGDELGGHMVAGHVDAVGEVVSVADEGPGRRLRIAMPAELAPLIAPKGSVALDGVSLTVNEVDKDGATDWFGVFVIPHTLSATTLAERARGDKVNLEADLIARYVARMLAARS